MYLLLCIFLFPHIFAQNQIDESTLEQVHVIFRHGDRTPDPTTYPNDPYSKEMFYPTGRGQLTLKGKRQEYSIGLNLRKRYNKFLGNIYTSDVMEARSTDYSRTKMSLQLALAGLWPPAPSQKWNLALNWQPIPYVYDSLYSDKVMRNSHFCKNFNTEYNSVLELPEVRKIVEPYRWIIDYVNEYSGMNVTHLYYLGGLYFTLHTQNQLGLQLPAWTENVFPYALEKIVVLDYFLKTYNDKLLKMAIGGLMHKIRQDIQAKMDGNSTTKLYLYSGHEYTIAYTLIALNVYSTYPHIPPYGSYITLELHKINHQYGIELYYNDYSSKTPVLIIIPNCEYFCPIDKFFSIIEDSSTNINPDC